MSKMTMKTIKDRDLDLQAEPGARFKKQKILKER